MIDRFGCDGIGRGCWCGGLVLGPLLVCYEVVSTD